MYVCMNISIVLVLVFKNKHKRLKQSLTCAYCCPRMLFNMFKDKKTYVPALNTVSFKIVKRKLHTAHDL